MQDGLRFRFWSLMVCLVFLRTPSKQKSPRKEEEINIVDLLRGHDPKDYESMLREHGVHNYRALLQAIEALKKEKEAEPGTAVRFSPPEAIWGEVQVSGSGLRSVVAFTSWVCSGRGRSLAAW